METLQASQSSITRGEAIEEAAIAVLRALPDHAASSVDEVAAKIGTSKLELIRWLRTDQRIARLVELKVIE